MKPTRPCVALIGDIVRSRQLHNQRQAAQEELYNTLALINADFSEAILAKFLITVGDEFQGLLCKASEIPEIIWRLETLFTYSNIRVGIGYGTLDTSLQEFAIGADGPVWHNARYAIDQAKHENHMGGCFSGFGATVDQVLNGIARLVYHHRHSMTKRQRQVITLLHNGLKQSEVAEELFISPQAVNQIVRTSGWLAYREGTQGWQALLRDFDTAERG